MGPLKRVLHLVTVQVANTAQSDPYPQTALATLGMRASIRIWFLTTEQILERVRKIGVWNLWEEELVNDRHAVLLCVVTMCTELTAKQTSSSWETWHGLLNLRYQRKGSNWFIGSAHWQDLAQGSNQFREKPEGH